MSNTYDEFLKMLKKHFKKINFYRMKCSIAMSFSIRFPCSGISARNFSGSPYSCTVKVTLSASRKKYQSFLTDTPSVTLNTCNKTIQLSQAPYVKGLPDSPSCSVTPPANARSSRLPHQQSAKAPVYGKTLWDYREISYPSRSGHLKLTLRLHRSLSTDALHKYLLFR